MSLSGQAIVAISVVFLLLSIFLWGVCVLQLQIEHRHKTYLDGPIKRQFRRVATISATFLMVDRALELDGARGGSAAASDIRSLFQSGIFIGMFVAAQIYFYYSIKALRVMTSATREFPRIFRPIFHLTVFGTYATFILFTIIAVALDRIIVLFIYFYIQMVIFLLMISISVYVIQKLYGIFVQSAKDSKRSLESQTQRKKAFFKTRFFLGTWCVIWFISTVYLIFISPDLFKDTSRGIDFTAPVTYSSGEILFYFLMVAPCAGLTWYAWIPWSLPDTEATLSSSVQKTPSGNLKNSEVSTSELTSV